MPTVILHNVIARKLRVAFPETPEGELALAVVSQAMKDSQYVVNKRKSKEAKRRESNNYYIMVEAREYLNSSMFLAEAAGVDSDWIRWVIKKTGLDIGRIK